MRLRSGGDGTSGGVRCGRVGGRDWGCSERDGGRRADGAGVAVGGTHLSSLDRVVLVVDDASSICLTVRRMRLLDYEYPGHSKHPYFSLLLEQGWPAVILPRAGSAQVFCISRSEQNEN